MITRENNPRFFEVAKEMGLRVEGDAHFTRKQSRELKFGKPLKENSNV